MVLVTVLAVILSYAVAFAIYANERGAALRRAAETSVIERIAFTAERLRDAPASRRAAIAEAIRDFSIRYQVSAAPDVTQGATAGAGGRVARGVAEQLDGADVRAQARTVEGPSRRWRAARRDSFGEFEQPLPRERAPGGVGERRREGPLVRSTELTVSVRLDGGAWLNARARLPGPRPA